METAYIIESMEKAKKPETIYTVDVKDGRGVKFSSEFFFETFDDAFSYVDKLATTPSMLGALSITPDEHLYKDYSNNSEFLIRKLLRWTNGNI